MAVLRVRIYGEACLSETSVPVEDFGQDLERLVADMAETMYTERGIGLAAPQVGVNQRAFVMDVDWVGQEGEEPKPEAQRRLQVFVNPEVTWESVDDTAIAEGCLSLPGIEGEVWRPDSVKLRWLDVKGEAREQKLEAIEARCVQHEIDHLDGVLFVDRMPAATRALLAGELRALRKSHMAADNKPAPTPQTDDGPPAY